MSGSLTKFHSRHAETLLATFELPTPKLSHLQWLAKVIERSLKQYNYFKVGPTDLSFITGSDKEIDQLQFFPNPPSTSPK